MCAKNDERVTCNSVVYRTRTGLDTDFSSPLPGEMKGIYRRGRAGCDDDLPVKEGVVMKIPLA